MSGAVSGTTTTARPLRRDAAENRRLLLDAAARVFAKHGLEAGVEEIARAAGVGVGTLYRRFPTKDALVRELVDDVLETMFAVAQEATSYDDGTGLERFLEWSSSYQAQHLGCLPRLWHTGADDERLRRLRALIDGLLADAKRHDLVRAELSSTDITMVMWSIRGVIETTRDVAPDTWRRHLSIVLAGLRPSPEQLASRPLTRAQVDQVLAES